MKRIVTLLAATLLSLGMMAGPALAGNGNGNNGSNGNHYGENAKILCSLEVGDTPVWELYGHKNLGQCVKVVVATQKNQAG